MADNFISNEDNANDFSSPTGSAEVIQGENLDVTERFANLAARLEEQQKQISEQKNDVSTQTNKLKDQDNLLRLGWLVVLLMVAALLVDVIFHKENSSSPQPLPVIIINQRP